MTEIERLIKAGKELNLTGDELKSWAETQWQLHTEKERVNHERLRLEQELELKKIQDEAALNDKKRLVTERQLELLNARREVSDLSSEVSSVGLDNSSAPRIQLPRLPVFQESTDDISVYLDRFEKYVMVNDFPKETQAMVLSTYLKGTALEVFHRLSAEESKDYEKLKAALLKRYQVTADHSRKQFRQIKRLKDESYSELRNRLEKDLSKWVEMSGASKSNPTQLWELIMKEQFLENCSPELKTYIADRAPSTCDDMAKIADRYDEARKSCPTFVHRQGGKPFDNRGQSPANRRPVQNTAFCRFCKRHGHTIDNCQQRKRSNRH